MRHFDIIKWLWVAGIIYTFLQGYTFYMQRQGEIAVGCSFLCAFCIFQFIRRLHTLYYLHMKMKNIGQEENFHRSYVRIGFQMKSDTIHKGNSMKAVTLNLYK